MRLSPRDQISMPHAVYTHIELAKLSINHFHLRIKPLRQFFSKDQRSTSIAYGAVLDANDHTGSNHNARAEGMEARKVF